MSKPVEHLPSSLHENAQVIKEEEIEEEGGILEESGSKEACPFGIICEFLEALIHKKYLEAGKLCSEILRYEPGNQIAIEYDSILKKMLTGEKVEEDEEESSGDDQSQRDSTYSSGGDDEDAVISSGFNSTANATPLLSSSSDDDEDNELSSDATSSSSSEETSESDSSSSETEESEEDDSGIGVEKKVD